jgi:hypothetical protein
MITAFFDVAVMATAALDALMHQLWFPANAVMICLANLHVLLKVAVNCSEGGVNGSYSRVRKKEAIIFSCRHISDHICL